MLCEDHFMLKASYVDFVEGKEKYVLKIEQVYLNYRFKKIKKNLPLYYDLREYIVGEYYGVKK